MGVAVFKSGCEGQGNHRLPAAGLPEPLPAPSALPAGRSFASLLVALLPAALMLLVQPAAAQATAASAALAARAAASSAPSSASSTATGTGQSTVAALRFAPLSDTTATSLPAALFNASDRAAAAAEPLLRVAVPTAAVPALLAAVTGDTLEGPLVQWLQAVAAALGLQLSPVLVADEAAQLQALRDGNADLALAVNPPLGSPQPGLVYSLGTGAQPLAWMLLREQRPVPLERARIALLDNGNSAEPSTDDRIRRHYPGATVQRFASIDKALQAVAEQRVDAYVGNLLPVLAVLQTKEVLGLELRQVWPGAAGHRHLVLREQRQALLPALNKALAAWRAANLPHQAVLRAAHQAALGLRLPLALPADVKDADTAVMDGLIQTPYGLPTSALDREPLGTHSTWRVGVVRNAKAPLSALSGLDAQGRHTGVAADLLQEVALQLGVMVQLQAFDSDAALVEALRAGRIDIAPLMEFTPDQASGLMFSLPWLELPQVLVGRGGGTSLWGLDSLRGRRLALAAGHPQRAELQRLHPGIQLVDAADGAAAVAMVQNGQADAAMDIKPVVQAALASPAGQGLQVMGDVAAFTTRYRVGLPESHRALLPLLDAALTDGSPQERQRSVLRWLVQDTPPQAPPWWHNPWALAVLAAAAAAVLALAGWAGWGAWRRRRVAGAPAEALGAAVPDQAAAAASAASSGAPSVPFAAHQVRVSSLPSTLEAGPLSVPSAPHAPVSTPVNEPASSPAPASVSAPVSTFMPAPVMASATASATAATRASLSEPPLPGPLPDPVAWGPTSVPPRSVPAWQDAEPEALTVSELHGDVAVLMQTADSAPDLEAAAPDASLPSNSSTAFAAPPSTPPDHSSLFERAVAAGVRLPPLASIAPHAKATSAADGPPLLWPYRPQPLPADPALTDADPFEDLHLEQLLDGLMVPFYRQAEGQGLRLVWSVDPVLPARIHSDPARVSLLIKLLMSHALRLASASRGRVAFKAAAGKLDNGKPALTLLLKMACPAPGDDATLALELEQAVTIAAELGGSLDLRSREGGGHLASLRLPLRGARREDR